MSAIGPDLPPHLLAKRKRQREESVEDRTSRTSGAKHEETFDVKDKKPRTIGPSMPPASLEERPDQAANVQEADSDDDDDLGPALPTIAASENDYPPASSQQEASDSANQHASSSAKLRRDDWMTMAPAQDDLAARMDPTRIRARGFNTGKSARSGGHEATSTSAWHETPEEKRKRLADEVLGITSQPVQSSERQPNNGSAKIKADNDARTAQRLRENTDKRGPTLLEQHRQEKPDKVDDDPSKRAFDREKDMGSGSRITGTQKRDMISKASDYSSRFSGGSYL